MEGRPHWVLADATLRAFASHYEDPDNVGDTKKSKSPFPIKPDGDRLRTIAAMSQWLCDAEGPGRAEERDCYAE